MSPNSLRRDKHESTAVDYKFKLILLILFIVISLIIFHFRHKIGEFHDRLRLKRRSRYINLNDEFSQDLQQGLSSGNFDLEENVGDNRKGLNTDQKLAITQIMREQAIDFDEARMIYTKQQFTNHEIDANGVPLDPKTVTFST